MISRIRSKVAYILIIMLSISMHLEVLGSSIVNGQEKVSVSVEEGEKSFTITTEGQIHTNESNKSNENNESNDINVIITSQSQLQRTTVNKASTDTLYWITTRSQLEAMNDDLSGNYRLGVDLDLSDGEWIPIGTKEQPFTGVFNAGNHTIKNLTITSESDYSGFFGAIENATIRNVKFEDAHIAGGDYTGVLAGYAMGASKYINNCHVYNSVITGKNYVGGLIGATDALRTASTTIEGSTAETIITTDGDYVGGMVGYMYGVIHCGSAMSTIYGKNYVGGLTGKSKQGRLEVCESHHNLYGENQVGGITGMLEDATAEQCLSKGFSQGKEAVGGISGSTDDSIISNTFVMGEIQGQDYVGGFIGKNEVMSYVRLSCSIGALTWEESHVGGIAGNTEQVDIKYSFYDVNKSNLIGRLVTKEGCKTYKMLEKKLYDTWNFDTIWQIDDGRSYPYLQLLSRPDIEILDAYIYGDGSSAYPYIIRSKEDFLKIRNDLSAHYILQCDIDFNGEILEPLGNEETPFTGSIAGEGYKISNFRIEEDSNNVGLFGYVNNGKIYALTLENAMIQGRNDVGGLVGYMTGSKGLIQDCHIKDSEVIGKGNRVGGILGHGTSQNKVMACSVNAIITGSGNSIGGIAGKLVGNIDRSYAAGKVVGNNEVGGLVGYLNGLLEQSATSNDVNGAVSVGGLVGYALGGEVQNSYSRSNIQGENYVGGIIGQTNTSLVSTINKSYFAGTISNEASNAGGICGNKGTTRLTVTNSYYDSLLCTNSNSLNFNVGITTYRMVSKGQYTSWDFTYIWSIDAGDSYPYLRNLKTQADVSVKKDETWPEGSGTIDSPYIIKSADALQKAMVYEPDAYYELASDIDCSDMKWEPVGTRTKPFTGAFNGNGYTMSNITIEQTGNYVGLFGYVNNGVIENVTLKGVEVTGNNYVGSVVGYLTGAAAKVSNCVVSGGYVTGNTSYIGGLVGIALNNSSIEWCITDVAVTGYKNDVGGIVGKLASHLEGGYALGSVRGVNEVGGVVGYLSGEISRCCSVSTVKGNNQVGGLVGISDRGTIANSYSLSLINGNNYIGGIAGSISNSGLSQISYSYYAGTITAKGGAVGGISGQEASTQLNIISSYYNKDQNTNLGGDLGRTEIELATKQTFENWDFDTIWEIEEGKKSPYLI